MKIVFPTDEHFPFQDDYARSVALQITTDFNPDLRICGSDGIDFYALSKFDKDPKRLLGIQREIDSWKAGQKEWRDASPNARVYFVPGNHEDRLRKYLWKHPEIYGLDLLRLRSVLGFAELGIDCNDDAIEAGYDEIVLFDKLVITHGQTIRKNSAYSAKAELEREGFSISKMTGHSHRGGSFYTRTRNGVSQAHECFCLCGLNPGYVVNPDWQQGIALAEIDKFGMQVELIPFLRNHKEIFATWRGKRYTQSLRRRKGENGN